MTILDILAPGVGVISGAGQEYAGFNAIRPAVSTSKSPPRLAVVSQHVDQVPRLVAYLPDDAPDRPSAVLGVNRKWYRPREVRSVVDSGDPRLPRASEKSP